MTLSHQFWRIFLGGIFYPHPTSSKTKYSSDKSFNTYQDDWMLNWLVSKMYDTIYPIVSMGLVYLATFTIKINQM